MDYRQRIIEEAAEMFRTYGIRAVTMDMLANRMGISKRTIYEVFSDKEELLQGVLKMMTVMQRDLMNEIMNESDNVIEAVYKVLDKMRSHFQNMSPAFQLDMKKYHLDLMKKLGSQSELPYNRNNTEFLLRGIKEGIFREDIDVEITNKCLVEVIKFSSDKDLFPPDAFTGKDVFRNTYLNYLRGISTRKGLDLFDFYDKKNN